MNKIAVFIGSNNETIAFNTTGTIKVFFKKDNMWDIVQEIPLVLNESMGLKEVRENIAQAAKLIQDCKMIVGKKVYGASYNVFETLKFTIWEFEGHPQTFLDDLLEQEEAYQKLEEAMKEQEQNYIKQINEGHYSINLQEMQSEKGNVSSKQAIIPFLKQGMVKQLDIICSHIPPWIECEAPKYCLKMETEHLATDSYKVMLLSM